MATRSGRPMLNDEDPHYTTRMIALSIRCRDLRNAMETIAAERGATFTARQRAAHLIAAGAWNLFLQERNWDRRQPLLQRAMNAYLEFEALLNPIA
jgi:hypothetical protein